LYHPYGDSAEGCGGNIKDIESMTFIQDFFLKDNLEWYFRSFEGVG
jgi:hypothetical protein